MIKSLSDIIWGLPMLVILLGTGIWLTVRSGFFQIRGIKRITDCTVGKLYRKSDGNRQEKRSVCTALAATMGTGNIVGVATAIRLGGAGSVFWMWTASFFGMMIVFAENRLSVRHKAHGAGPMGYLSDGGRKTAASVIYAAACVMSSLCMGNMAQTNSMVTSLFPEGSSLSPVAGGVIALSVGAVILGGAKNIGKTAEKIIPFVSVLYILMSILLIVCRYNVIDDAFLAIFKGAFSPRPIGGGATGYVVSQALSAGLRRGVFSNEAGLGSCGIIHSDCEDETRQGMWGIVEVFFDTVICCTLTALVILTAFPECKAFSLDGAELVSSAFSSLYGTVGGILLAVCLVLFGFATLIGWSAVGEKAWGYLTKGRYIVYYKYIYIIFILIGAIISVGEVWFLSDIFNALMALPNLYGIIRAVIKDREFFRSL